MKYYARDGGLATSVVLVSSRDSFNGQKKEVSRTAFDP